MGEIVKSARDLSTTYSGLKIQKNNGAFNSCGYGVRLRDDETDLDKTYFCTSHLPVGGGAELKYVKFRISTGSTTAGAIIVSWWYRDSGDDTLFLVDSASFDKPAAHWVSDTEYFYELDNSILLPGVVNRTYYMAIYSLYAKFDATDTGAVIGVTGSGDSSAISPLNTGVQSDDRDAVSFESWGDPIQWDQVLDGGGIEEENIDWKHASYCTGTMTNPGNIWDGTSAYATSGAQNNYIAIDLGAGLTATTTALSDEFPDYATSGIRAISSIEAVLTLATGGDIAILYSSVDSPTMPSVTGGDWSLLGHEEYASGTPVTLTIDETPAMARWILIIELGTSLTDQIEEVTINQVATKVTTGEFPVSFLNAYHKCWTKNSPIEDTVYKVLCFNAAGAESPLGNPFTNRRNID